jgi:prefoldin subunit 5
MRAELQSEVKKKTAYLMRAIEELQAEIDARRQAEAEVETTHWELRAVSRKAESAQVAASVLRSVGNMLKSVNVSADLVSNQMKQSKIANVVHVGTLIRDHAGDLGKFMTQDPRGRKLPAYIAQLGEHLDEEQTILSMELESLRKNIEHIKQLLLMHQKCASLASSVDVTRAASMVDGARHTSMVMAA